MFFAKQHPDAVMDLFDGRPYNVLPIAWSVRRGNQDLLNFMNTAIDWLMVNDRLHKIAATYGETKLRGNTWELPLQARAYENGVYVVAVNRCGMEQGRNHIGRSMIVDPVGADILAVASSDTPELLVATVDLDNVATAQTSLPWWRDRRPELYAPLCAAAN